MKRFFSLVVLGVFLVGSDVNFPEWVVKNIEARIIMEQQKRRAEEEFALKVAKRVNFLMECGAEYPLGHLLFTAMDDICIRIVRIRESNYYDAVLILKVDGIWFASEDKETGKMQFAEKLIGDGELEAIWKDIYVLIFLYRDRDSYRSQTIRSLFEKLIKLTDEDIYRIIGEEVIK